MTIWLTDYLTDYVYVSTLFLFFFFLFFSFLFFSFLFLSFLFLSFPFFSFLFLSFLFFSFLAFSFLFFSFLFFSLLFSSFLFFPFLFFSFFFFPILYYSILSYPSFYIIWYVYPFIDLSVSMSSWFSSCLTNWAEEIPRDSTWHGLRFLETPVQDSHSASTGFSELRTIQNSSIMVNCSFIPATFVDVPVQLHVEIHLAGLGHAACTRERETKMWKSGEEMRTTPLNLIYMSSWTPQTSVENLWGSFRTLQNPKNALPPGRAMLQ